MWYRVMQAAFYLDVWCLVCEGWLWCGGVVGGKVKQAAFYLDVWGLVCEGV